MRKRPPEGLKTHAITKSADRQTRDGHPEASPRLKGDVLATDAEWKRHERFLTAVCERGCRASTADAYDSDWRAVARWYFGATGEDFDLENLTPMDGADYRGFLIRTAKPATAARRLLFLRTYVAEAFRSKEVSRDLHEHIQRLRAPTPQPAAPRSLTAEEARAALRKVEREGSLRDKTILFVFLLTGVRVGELSGLEVRDLEVTERRGALHIRAEIAKGGRERVVPLPKDARDYLKEYLAERKDGDPALFLGQRGRMTPAGIRDVVVRFSGVPPHRLRHTYAYEFLRDNNNDLVALADILGHASLNTTRGYTRRRKEDLEEAAERVRYARDPATSKPR
jgi:integrase